MRIGSLCTGYGGLDIAANNLFPDSMVVWAADPAPGPSRLLAHRHPHLHNFGDLTIDPDRFTEVDILTAGFPCQPASLAGPKLGVADERWIWPAISDLIAYLRPRLVLLENVPGLLTVSNGTAWAQVLGDLKHLNYQHRHAVVSASDIGACHQRRRLFVVAWSDTIPQPTRYESRPRPYAGPFLPTPTARDWRTPGGQEARHSPNLPDIILRDESLSRYAEALARHAETFGHPAPSPVTASGLPSPAFVEWAMMLPAGYVTGAMLDPYDQPQLFDGVDEPFTERNRHLQLQLLGNGVVPAQATAAFCKLLCS